jgi:hypothetical protein
MPRKTEDPLIRVSINWKKWKHLFRKTGEFILKTILRILTLLVRGTFIVYKGFSNFAKSKQYGIWIIFLIIILSAVVSFSVKALSIKKQRYEELQQFNQQQIKETEKLIQENQELEQELEQTKEELEAELNKPVTVATARVTANKPLPEEIKGYVATYADQYGVNRKYQECIITCESGGNSEAIGDNGAAVGVAQYHLGTYLADAKRAGLPVQDDRRDPEKSVKAMAAALSRGEDSKWTASKYCN